MRWDWDKKRREEMEGIGMTTSMTSTTWWSPGPWKERANLGRRPREDLGRVGVSALDVGQARDLTRPCILSLTIRQRFSAVAHHATTFVSDVNHKMSLLCTMVCSAGSPATSQCVPKPKPKPIQSMRRKITVCRMIGATMMAVLQVGRRKFNTSTDRLRESTGRGGGADHDWNPLLIRSPFATATRGR